MGESPRESELSDGSAWEKILEAAFFQKLGEVLQEKQWSKYERTALCFQPCPHPQEWEFLLERLAKFP